MVYCRHIVDTLVFPFRCCARTVGHFPSSTLWHDGTFRWPVLSVEAPLSVPLLPLSLRTCACAIWGASRTYWYMSVIKALLLLLLLVVNQNWFTLQSQGIMKFLMDLTLPKNKKIWGNLRLKCVLWDYKTWNLCMRLDRALKQQAQILVLIPFKKLVNFLS